MTAQITRASRSRPLSAGSTARAFRIIVVPARAETYGIVVDETYGDGDQALTTRVTAATPAQVGRIADAVFAAVRGSGHAPSVLAFTRKKPIRIDEVEGVRLALILLTTGPISKHARVREIVAGVNAMSVEETYYWYSKCIGVDASRANKALRILLSGDRD
ncbi:hypothetical protein LTT02_13020 [Mycolicibacterium smegmatis]|uniref:DUF7680 family protein n=1 Tax=Mycolicibacterium smegmatis TaxID=1772 RepID=UPI0005DA40F2|nr:hypothetical protein [Mycolicibacterium smegmatis]MDF1903337.1 hypothetical protein [Mycolicibacterium smegmatis]MDF1909860.1 hypothetical protein [Mycolicibacterium smegmatis]MDF1921801.1 hypothetical protein [Mycolicibacterium smegmatis]MDF1928248.1 hypothetical protein [Mycolicibacterium smegmatis]UAK53475.1 hypothetical protein K8P01_23110 [Mycolicibacterium smegmatis]